MKRHLSFLIGCLVVVFVLSSGVFSPRAVLAQDTIVNAVARLQDAQGSVVGSAFFTQAGNSVWAVIQVNNLPPGFHAMHVHSVGQCDGSATPPFSSVGGVLGEGAGELPELLVLQDGTGYMATTTDRFRVADLIDADGSSLLIHTGRNADMGAGIACGVVHTLASADAAAANLAAIAAVPLDQLPAKVSREEGAEHGTLVLTLQSMGGIQIVGDVRSAEAGQIGEVTLEGDMLVFTFTEITYDVAPINLPGGFRIGAQSIKLDPAQSSTLKMDINTGEIFRDFHWIQTATDVLYNASPSIALGDTAKAEVAEVRDLGNNQYAIRLLTHWKSLISLETWTIGGVTMPSGDIEATAEFDGIYILDFNK